MFFQPKITVFLPIFINKFYSAKKILSSPQIFQKGFGLQEIPHDSFRRRNKGFVPIVIFNFITRSSKEMGELHYISLHTVKTNKKINTPLFLKCHMVDLFSPSYCGKFCWIFFFEHVFKYLFVFDENLRSHQQG